MSRRMSTRSLHVTAGARGILLAIAATGTALTAACSDANAPSGPDQAPELHDAVVTAPDSAGLTFVVTAAALHSDSARVVAVSSPRGYRIATDYVPVVQDTARIVVAGLHSGTGYTWHVQLIGPGGSRVGPAMNLSAGTLPLPSALRDARINTTAGAPTVPYIETELVTNDVKYEVVFDSSGALVWYRPMAAGHNGRADFEMQPTGTFTAYDGTSTGWQPVAGTWLELGLDGAVRKMWTAPPGSYMDQHEFRLRVEQGDTVAYFFIYDLVPLDMTDHCGAAAETTAAHRLVRVDAGGFHTIFNSRDRFDVADWTSPPLCGIGDYDHPNALDFDANGALLVSWRNLGAITALDPATGSVLWQLGGEQATLTLTNDPLNGTGGQHSVRASGPNTILIYDNGTNHTPQRSRMVEYAIDAKDGRAHLTRQYLDANGIYTAFMGSVAPLANGGVLIGWSTAATITEVDANGTRVWEGVLELGGAAQQFYRALPLASLYHYQQP